MAISNTGFLTASFIGDFACSNCGCEFKEKEEKIFYVIQVDITYDKKHDKHVEITTVLMAKCPNDCRTMIAARISPEVVKQRVMKIFHQVRIHFNSCLTYFSLNDIKVERESLLCIPAPFSTWKFHCNTCRAYSWCCTPITAVHQITFKHKIARHIVDYVECNPK
jgi:hypothetical protein